jgi:hypothetical protein
MDGTRTISRPDVGASYAHGYYRRLPLNGDLIRPAKKLRGKSNLRAIDPSELELGNIVTLTVYPELVLRDTPWTITGIVIEINSDVVTVRETTPPSYKIVGGDYTIPIRFFIDNRVYVREEK